MFENITVVLSVEDFIGCTSSSNSLDVIVNPLPEAIVSPDINGYTVEFNNLSVNATDYEWNFGDGNTSIDFEPSHAFTLDGEVDMYLVASNNCGSDTAFLNLTSVSIDEAQLFEGFSLYPNPTAGQLNLELDSKHTGEINISVYSVAGEELISKALQIHQGQNLVELNLDRLPIGMYMVHIASNNSSSVRSFLLTDY